MKCDEWCSIYHKTTTHGLKLWWYNRNMLCFSFVLVILYWIIRHWMSIFFIWRRSKKNSQLRICTNFIVRILLNYLVESFSNALPWTYAKYIACNSIYDLRFCYYYCRFRCCCCYCWISSCFVNFTTTTI